MKVGDPKQAVILGVVAFGAVAFLVFQLVPKSGGISIAQLTHGPEALTAKSNAVDDLPEFVTRDAFSHPRLITTADEASMSGQVEGTAAPDKTPQKSSKPFSKPRLPALEGNLPTVPEFDPKQAVPEENAGKSQKEEQKPKLTLKLVGVIDMGQPTACIEVNGKRLEEFEKGQTLADGVTLGQVNSSEVIVRVNGKSHTLAMGKELTL